MAKDATTSISHEEATQPSTQHVLDPRRLGRNNSGLRESDISDVLCILHPSSPGAFRIVRATAEHYPQHILQNDGYPSFGDLLNSEQLEDQETFVLDDELGSTPQDLALRFSSQTITPVLGFCFGRNRNTCDIVIDVDSVKRVSNLHFRIFVNQAGVLMLEDMSTNGTLVDDKHLKGKNAQAPATRMLVSGSIIQIPSSITEEAVKFIVRIPSRAGHAQQYHTKMQTYMVRLAQAEQLHYEQARPARYHQTTMKPPANPHGMKWDGGDEFNVVDTLGKGAFATVYRLATKLEGKYFAAKELEKKRVMKNGRMDQRLNNEMQIMKSIRHANIVEYIGYQDHLEHLYIIMEFVPCGDLQQYIQLHSMLPEPQARLMSRQVLDALHYLHGMQITHRDIKPDNILIKSYDPFTVKLSDFGLSKVVRPQETFLRTFCGTLLYCAPEVFPHYEEHVAKKGQKRRRTGQNPPSNFHSYSQSVDIWSYAAVLWFSLSGVHAFEGIVDQTGRGMFNQIMDNQLDTAPLLLQDISSEAIDLLCKMLDTDPSRRPCEIECLNHPWLADGSTREGRRVERNIAAIAEEDEAAAENAQAFSQLNIQETVANTRAGAQVIGFDSGDFDSLDPRLSKRIKPDPLVPRTQTRTGPIPSSSSDNLVGILEQENQEGTTLPEPQTRLFGEIKADALKSSGALGIPTTSVLELPSSDMDTSSNFDSSTRGAQYESFQPGQVTSKLFRSDGSVFAATSLLGAEALVRDLNMESPNFAVSSDAPSKAQSFEPRTPGSFASVRMENRNPVLQKRASQDITPKQKKPFDRQIRMAIPAALLIDPNERNSIQSLPTTSRVSLEQHSTDDTPNVHMLPGAAVAAENPPDFSPPRFGKLTSTKDSIRNLCIKIDSRVTTWGRITGNQSGNHIVYPDSMDIRVPNRGIGIFFHSFGIEKKEKEGQDWSTMSGLHTLVKLYSRNCIWVNGVKLSDTDTDGVPLCGRLFTGDVITIFDDRISGRGQEALRLICEFYVGEAAGLRPEHRPFEIIRVEEPGQI